MYCKIISKKLPPKLFDKLIKIYGKYVTYQCDTDLSKFSNLIIDHFNNTSLFGCYYDNSEVVIDQNEVVVKFKSSKINEFKDSDVFLSQSEIDQFNEYTSNLNTIITPNNNEIIITPNNRIELNNLIRLIMYALYNKKIDYNNIMNRLKMLNQFADGSMFNSISQIAHDDKCISCYKIYPINKYTRDFTKLESLYCTNCYEGYKNESYQIHFGNYIESLMYIAETLRNEFDELIRITTKPIPNKLIINDIKLCLQ